MKELKKCSLLAIQMTSYIQIDASDFSRQKLLPRKGNAATAMHFKSAFIFFNKYKHSTCTTEYLTLHLVLGTILTVTFISQLESSIYVNLVLI